MGDDSSPGTAKEDVAGRPRQVCDPGLSSLVSLGHHNLSHSVRSKNVTVRNSQQEGSEGF